MNNKKTLNSKLFTINYYGLNINIELFTKEYIYSKLKEYERENYFNIDNIMSIPSTKPFKNFKTKYIDRNQNEIYHFFTYIKFFKDLDGQEYGLVGGKTNYYDPDIRFDYIDNEKDHRFARHFLYNNKLQWSKNIIIINHNKYLNNREKDEQQALFLEYFVQRQFNLFKS